MFKENFPNDPFSFFPHLHKCVITGFVPLYFNISNFSKSFSTVHKIS